MSETPGGRRGDRRPDAGVPLLLLPVRIETCFMDLDGGPELWLRVYPDQVHVRSHEPELTEHETADGAAFWDTVWRAGSPPPTLDAIQAAWRGLVSRYGSPRTAWIVREMTPVNLAQQPAAPTPDGADPSPAMVPPQPPQRAGSWTKAPTAAALPDAWTVVAEGPGAPLTATGRPIQPDLAVSLDPGSGTLFPPDSPVDAGMQWMVDFAKAVDAGMALALPLTAEQRRAGFDRIFVYGLRAADQDPSATLRALLDAHHYTDGLAILAQGAPTNNTPDGPAAYRSAPDTGDASFAVEWRRTPPLAAGSDGALLAAALSYAPGATPFDRVEGADRSGVRAGRDMLTALWPATLGYFLRQMMAPVFTDGQVAEARAFVLDTVVPRGPLPAFRVGRTPYGVLPTTALELYRREDREGTTVEAALAGLCRKLLPAFAASIVQAPHVNATADPDADLVHVLGMDASSMTFHGRTITGDRFMWNYMVFLGLPQDAVQAWYTQHLVRARQVVDTYGSPSWQPRLLSLDFRQDDFVAVDPTVTADPLSETDPLKDNYIAWLQTATPADIGANAYPGGTAPAALLYKFLRQSVLLAYAQIATDAEVAADRLPLDLAREPELVNVSAARVSVTPYEVLARASPVQELTWAEYLHGFPIGGSPYGELNDLRTSLGRLATLPTAELDRLLTETLDACSHRLDVWVTAIATSLLARQRGQRSQGLHLGSFGWIERVRPPAPRPPVAGAERESVTALDRLRAKQTGVERALRVPRQPLIDNGGFIHAPSYEQAAAAAVLRSGYMTHRGTASGPLLSLDLSSARVQRALWFLEGVRRGQSLAALLGYRFEEGLHAAGLDRYIQPFRDAYPVAGDALTPTRPGQESVAASNVVDGLRLRTAWDGGGLPSGGAWGAGLPPPGADQDAVIALLRDLDDVMDALNDLSIAEGVFQVMRGNFGRAGGLLDAVSRGAHAPEPQVVQTPRGGTDVTHRVLTLFADDPVPSPAWAAVAPTARALAEPWLDAWTGSLLPDPATVRCTASHTTSGVTTRQVISLADLALRPLDVLAIADTTQKPQRAELEERIRYRAALAPDVDTIEISFDRTGLPAGTLLFPEVLAGARAIRDLVGAARPLAPEDLVEPERNAAALGGQVVTAELAARAQAVAGRLQADASALAAAGPATVRDALLRCSQYGVPGAVPATSSGADPGLDDRRAKVLEELQRRQKAIPGTIATAADATVALTAVFGGGFTVLPRLHAPDAAALQGALAASAELTASDPRAPLRWLLQLAHVRPAVDRLQSAYTFARLLGAVSGGPELTLGQLPVVANDRWLALPLAGGQAPQKGRIAFAAVASGDVTAAATYAGLLIDEFPDRIPNATESAAVAFHYEEPRSRAPQALLLAVCPDQRAVWDDALVLATLRETLQRAQVRAVDLGSLLNLGQVLPALYVPFNVDALATISTHFQLLRGVSLASGLQIQ